MTTRISLRGDDAEQFNQFKQAIKEARNGNEPSNAETLRLLMQEVDPQDAARRPFRS